MKNADRQTRSHLMELFKEHGFNPRNHLGQNFLIDINIIEFIVREGQLTSYDVVLEVGTGTGGMTMFMIEEAAHVVSVEIDRNMHMLASSLMEDADNVSLFQEHSLQTGLCQVSGVHQTVMTCSNHDRFVLRLRHCFSPDWKTIQFCAWD